MLESSKEAMNELLGANYEIFEQNGDHIILEKSMGSPNLALLQLPQDDGEDKPRPKPDKTFDDYAFQFYVGSLTVVGLFILFRMIQKSR